MHRERKQDGGERDPADPEPMRTPPPATVDVIEQERDDRQDLALVAGTADSGGKKPSVFVEVDGKGGAVRPRDRAILVAQDEIEPSKWAIRRARSASGST